MADPASVVWTLGILRSADGGATWSLISSDATGTHSFAGLGFSKIAFSTSNPQLVGGGGGGGSGGVVVSVSPRSASKFPTEQQQFTASVSGTSNTQVTWQVNGATGGSLSVGTVDNTGLYTAPSVVPTPNVPLMVSAISQADVTKSDTATVTIKAPTPSGTYMVTITATVGSLTQSTTATLVVD